MSYTKGPWKISNEHNGTFIRGAGGGLVASMEAGSPALDKTYTCMCQTC